jgi:predicted transcriptional regulator
MLIYATRPWCSLAGACVINQIRIASPEVLWAEIGERTGCTRSEFRAYFAGARQGFAIEMKDIRRIKGITLERLRAEFKWRPPVSWCRVPPSSNLISVIERMP